MIYFIGAGPGAVDLITVRGAELLGGAGIIVYAGSLVNPELVRKYAPENCRVYDSSHMTLDEILAVLAEGHSRQILTVRLHSGDPALYGAVREQFEALRECGIPFEVVPGVSSLFAASAALKTEYMIPGHVQTLIISRVEGRTPAPESTPENESVALFLSAGMTEKACSELISRGYPPETPAAIVYRASWPEERVIRGTLATLPEMSQGITKSALILAGDFLSDEASQKSRLYDKTFSHEYRNSCLHQQGHSFSTENS
ncbi:MAG: precorrin-4 C(11)-methyltransferase [Synergistaceae bacterium]|nr:precorrin-4 C(11)-methyltransferase [Synergistaceae bacterium]